MTVHVVDNVVLSGGSNSAPQQPDPQMLQQAQMAAQMMQHVQNRGRQIIAKAARTQFLSRFK